MSEEIQKEKRTRVKYQDLIYHICNRLDAYRPISRRVVATKEDIDDVFETIRKGSLMQAEICAGLQGEIAALRAENQRLQKQLSETGGIEAKPLGDPVKETARKLQLAEKALEPFARYAAQLEGVNWVPDGCPINTDPGGISDFTVGMIRRAAKALAELRRKG
jgi:hypothetical protein